MRYQFHMPTRVVLEHGVSKRVADFLPELGVDRVLLLTDKGVRQAGLIDQIVQNLQGHAELFQYDEVKSNPRDKDCDHAAKFAREHDVNGIVAVGGGSVMDTAKAVAILLTHGGSINDWEGTDILKTETTPLICIPTTAGTGSEVTCIAVITDTDRKVKMGVVDHRIAPRIALLDPLLTQHLPAPITASTGMDALTHAIEAYTSKVATPITDALALQAIGLIRDNLVEAVVNGSNLVARENMMIASTIAGIAFGNSDVGSVHCIAEAIGGLYDTPHGVANSIFLPFVFEVNSVADINRHAEVAYALGANRQLPAEEAVAEGVRLLFALSERIGIPKFRDLPYVNPQDFPRLASVAKHTPMDASNARELSEEDYLAIIEKAYR